MNLYHMTKFSAYFSFTGYCFYTKISSFMLALSIRIALDCFKLLIFYSEKFSTDVCRLPYAVNVNLNLSNEFYPSSTDKLPLQTTSYFVLGSLPVGLLHLPSTKIKSPVNA